jgi:hypothetical protein
MPEGPAWPHEVKFDGYLMRRDIDAIEQCARFGRIEHRRLPGRRAGARAPTRPG